MRMMKETLRQCLLILLVTSTLAAVNGAFRIKSLHWNAQAGEISWEEASALENPLWIDARIETDYRFRHFPGALLLNEEDWESGFAELLGVWSPEQTIVVYCSSQSCMRSHHVSERLREELGIESVFALKGGWELLLEQDLVLEGES